MSRLTAALGLGAGMCASLGTAWAQEVTVERERKEALASQFVAQKEQQTRREFTAAGRHRMIEQLASTRSTDDLLALTYDPAAARRIVTSALGDSGRDLIFTPVAPCRIIDTRLAGGILAAETSRSFFVAGTTGFPTQGGKAGGCGVPEGATAAVLNIVAVTPAGPGNLVTFAYDEPTPATPLASVINYGAVTGLNAIANGTVVPICDPLVGVCTFDLIVHARVNSVHLVVDVTGYMGAFPVGEIMTTVLASDGTGSGLDADTIDGVDSGVLQARVTGTCPAGSSIQAVSANGSVTCESTMTTVLASGGPGSGLNADLLDNLNSSSFQLRVSSSCVAGSSIRAIAADGTVTCDVNPSAGPHYLTISALDCVPQGTITPAAYWTCNSFNTRTTLGQQHPCYIAGRPAVVDTYVCNLDLPSGSIITQVLAYGGDYGATGYFEANIVRQAWPSFGTIFPLPTWATSGVAATGTTTLTVLDASTVPATLAIDTATSRYFLAFAVQESTTMFHGFRVQYTLN